MIVSLEVVATILKESPSFWMMMNPYIQKNVKFPKTNSSPLKIGRAPKGNNGLPTIHFQVLLLLVSEGGVKLANPPTLTLKRWLEVGLSETFPHQPTFRFFVMGFISAPGSGKPPVISSARWHGWHQVYPVHSVPTSGFPNQIRRIVGLGDDCYGFAS